jgi:regulator of RNase E activity RraA
MDVSRFTRLATTAYADVIARDRVMDFGMRPLWQPISAKRGQKGVLNGPVTCGGVSVAPGDVVIADEEGIVVLPAAKAEERAIDDLVAKLGIDA